MICQAMYWSGVATGITRNTIEYEIIKIDRFPKYKETKFDLESTQSYNSGLVQLTLRKKK